MKKKSRELLGSILGSWMAKTQLKKQAATTAPETSTKATFNPSDVPSYESEEQEADFVSDARAVPENKFFLDLHKVHGNDGDVYTMYNAPTVPKTEEDSRKLIASLESSAKMRHKVVIKEEDFPGEGKPFNTTLISSGMMATAMKVAGLRVTKTREYDKYTFFQVESGLCYCICRNEAN